MFMLASLDLGSAMLCAFSGLVLVWLYPAPSWLCLGVTTCETYPRAVGLLNAYPFSALCDVVLALLAYATHLAFFASIHSFAHLLKWSCMSLTCLCHQAYFLLSLVGSHLSLIHETPSTF